MSYMENKTDYNDLCGHLHKLLADVRLLTIKIQMYHWNVKNINFFTLHKFFEKQYIKLFEFQDMLAENIKKLNFYVNFNYINMNNSNLSNKNMNELNHLKMLKNLEIDYNIVINNIKNTLKICDMCEEEAIKNDLADFLNFMQKNLWFIKSHFC